MKAYTFDIDLETLDITNIQHKFRTDLSGYGMEDFHCGKVVGNETDFATKP